MSKSGPRVSMEELAGSSLGSCCGGLGGGGSIGARAVEGELRARVGMGCGVGAGLLMKTGTIQGMGMGQGDQPLQGVQSRLGLLSLVVMCVPKSLHGDSPAR